MYTPRAAELLAMVSGHQLETSDDKDVPTASYSPKRHQLNLEVLEYHKTRTGGQHTSTMDVYVEMQKPVSDSLPFEIGRPSHVDKSDAEGADGGHLSTLV